MADIFSSRDRARIMSRVKSENTVPEVIVRKYLFSKGLRFKKNVPSLPGKPDIVLPKYKTIVFVHGCFWHGHIDCKHSALPKSNIAYWKNKVEKNIERDRTSILKLSENGWRVFVIWECEIRRKDIFSSVNLEDLYKLIIAGLEQ